MPSIECPEIFEALLLIARGASLDYSSLHALVTRLGTAIAEPSCQAPSDLRAAHESLMNELRLRSGLGFTAIWQYYAVHVTSLTQVGSVRLSRLLGPSPVSLPKLQSMWFGSRPCLLLTSFCSGQTQKYVRTRRIVRVRTISHCCTYQFRRLQSRQGIFSCSRTIRGTNHHVKRASETLYPQESTWTWLLSRMLHLQLLSRSAPSGPVGSSSPYPCYSGDISKIDVFNSYFELALEDWSEPLGDLIVFCGTTRLSPGSSGNPNYTPLN
jgi:hypothetical protein